MVFPLPLSGWLCHGLVGSLVKSAIRGSVLDTTDQSFRCCIVFASSWLNNAIFEGRLVGLGEQRLKKQSAVSLIWNFVSAGIYESGIYFAIVWFAGSHTGFRGDLYDGSNRYNFKFRHCLWEIGFAAARQKALVERRIPW